MKTKISRIGKKSLSVVIALMMIVSTMLVGMVTTNAATSVTLYFASATTVTFKAIGYNGSDKTVTLQKVDGETYNGMQVYKTTEFDDSYYYLHIQYGNEARQDNKINNSYFSNYDGKIYDEKTGTWSTYSGGSSTEPSESFYLEYWHNNKHNFIKYNSYSDGVYTWETKFDFGQFASDGKFRLTNSETWTDNKETTFCVPAYKMSNSKSTSSYVNVTASGVSVVTESSEFGSDAGSWGHSKYYDIKLKNVDTNKTYVVTYEPGKSNSLDGTITIADKSSTTTTYNITKGNEVSSQGTFSVDKTTAAENDAVTVTTSPASGYEVYTVTYSYGTTTSNATGSGNTYTFNMPASNVTVNVTFKATATPTTNYYIGGRFGESWNANSTNHPFASTATTGLYKYETNKTVSELSANFNESYGATPQFFIIHEGNDVYTEGNNFYCGEEVNNTGSLHNFQLAKNSSNAVTLTKYNDKNTTANRLIRFDDADNTSTGAVTIWLDASDTSAMKLYYTVAGESDVSATLKANSTVYATSSKKLDGITLTTKNNGEAVESAVTMTDAGNINGIYYYSYKLTADANAVQFDYSVGGTAKTKTASCVEGKNVYSLDNDSWSVYEIDKSKAYTSGLWVDVQPSVVHTNIALIKWTNKKGSNSNDGNNYKLYIPGGTDLTLPVYSSADYVTIKEGNNTLTVNDGETFTFNTSSEYTVKIGTDTTEYKLKVMKSGSASLYTTTSNDLPTASTGNVLEKTAYKNGGFMTVSNEGKIVNEVQTLSQIKGRGNSTWEASGKHYGKYAYNIKLASAINPLKKFDKDAKSKSFCLLANNSDESSLRNILTYDAATKAGLANTPNFEVVDVYNNGEYLGSYLITEKVDVALDKKLVQGDPVDEYHTYTYDDSKKKQSTYNYGSGTFDFSYVDTGSVAAGVNIETKSYLLEFDLRERAQAEHCWFVTPKGQYIALKTPEDLNEEEMRFIIRKWCEAEDAVYNKSYEDASNLIDMKSFAQVYLIQEWSKNLDAAATSYYIYYDGRQANPKWQATPIWDYDWAFGGHKDTKDYNPNSDSDANNTLNDHDGWFAKYKTILQKDGEEGDYKNSWNFQAQLANNDDFWNDVITVWNSGFYTSASAAISDLATYYTNNSASYAMNETRYGFVNNSPLPLLWGSNDTGNTPEEAKDWLVSWSTNRLNWMNTKLARTAQLSGVTISADSESYTAGETVTITAKPQNPVGGAVITYQIFRKTETDADFVAGAVTSDGVFTFANANAGTYQYKVVATDAYGFTKESDVLSVTVSGVSGSHDVKIYFKSSSTYAYKPLLKLNNGNYVEMTKTEKDLIGTNYSGSIKFYWYSYTVNVDSTNDNTIYIKTAGTSASGSFTSKLDSTTFYFGIDDLMEGTELVDLSNQPEYIRNYHHTARHMVFSGLASDGTLGFTKVNGIRYQMGSYNPDEVTTVDTASVASVSNTLTTASSFSIKSATAVQMLNVEKAKASLLQMQLLDVNLDGIVDIKDATLIQKALAY